MCVTTALSREYASTPLKDYRQLSQYLPRRGKRSQPRFDGTSVASESYEPALPFSTTNNPGDVSRSWSADAKLFAVRGPDRVRPARNRNFAGAFTQSWPCRSLLKAGPEEQLGLLVPPLRATEIQWCLAHLDWEATPRAFSSNKLQCGLRWSSLQVKESDATEVLLRPYPTTGSGFGFQPRTTRMAGPRSDLEDRLLQVSLKLAAGDFYVVCRRDLSDEHWLVSFTFDQGPDTYFIYGSKGSKGSFPADYLSQAGRTTASWNQGHQRSKPRDGLDLAFIPHSNMDRNQGRATGAAVALRAVFRDDWGFDVSWGCNGLGHRGNTQFAGELPLSNQSPERNPPRVDRHWCQEDA